MKSDRIIFMGTPEVAKEYLEKLIQNKFNVVSVYTQPSRKKGRGMKIHHSSVYLIAKKNGINIHQPHDFDDNITIKKFSESKPKLVIVMGYGLIIPKKVLSIPNLGFINIHLSLLPKWRGAAPVEHAILNRDKITGVTIFKLDEKIDTGAIFISKKLKIDKDITKGELYIKLNEMGCKLLIDYLPKILEQKIFPKKQTKLNFPYASKITPEKRKIDFYNDVKYVYDQIRAFSPTPCSWFLYKNQRIKIISSLMKICSSVPSVIINKNFHIGCNNGKIIPLVVQKEGKRPMKIDDFLRGFSFEVDQKVNE